MKLSYSLFLGLLLVVILAAIVVFFPGAFGLFDSPVVEFVVEDDVSGVIAVVEGTVSPENNDIQPVDSGWRIYVPANGRAVVSDVSILHEWHKLSARRQGGKVLPVDGFDASPEGGIKFFNLGTKNGAHLYLVGTRSDKDAYYNQGIYQSLDDLLSSSENSESTE